MGGEEVTGAAINIGREEGQTKGLTHSQDGHKILYLYYGPYYSPYAGFNVFWVYQKQFLMAAHTRTRGVSVLSAHVMSSTEPFSMHAMKDRGFGHLLSSEKGVRDFRQSCGHARPLECPATEICCEYSLRCTWVDSRCELECAVSY